MKRCRFFLMEKVKVRYIGRILDLFELNEWEKFVIKFLIFGGGVL